MRHLTTLLLLILLVGCASNREFIEGSFDVRGLDFRDYADRGFLITPESYEGEYLSLGQLHVTMFPRARKGAAARQHGTYVPGNWYVERISSQQLIDSLYTVASGWGADAIVNLSVSSLPHPDEKVGLPGEPSAVQMSGIEVSGLAIKRSGQ